MKYSLRSLMIFAMLAPPLLAAGYFCLVALDSLELRTLLAFATAAVIVMLSLKSALRGEV